MNILYEILGKAEPINPNTIPKLEKTILRFGKMFQIHLTKHVNNQTRTRGIHTPKSHKMMSHIVEFVKWWGLSGMINEQNIENFHQLYKKYFKAVISMKGPRKILTLEQRLANKNMVINW